MGLLRNIGRVLKPDSFEKNTAATLLGIAGLGAAGQVVEGNRDNNALIERLMRENPGITPEQAQQIATRMFPKGWDR